jgi:sporulation protein YlmC with PRC-barrel domain
MSAPREIRAELLLGRLVVDRTGKPVGRVEEIQATWEGDQCLVQELHLGPHALVERFSALPLVSHVLRLFGRKQHRPLRVGWQAVDLSDPEHPRLRAAIVR